MIKIIERGGFEECVDYSMCYVWRDDPNAGFSFNCDENGNINENEMSELAHENLRKCRSGEHDVINQGVQAHRWRYRRPSIGKCHCGRRIALGGFTNTCDCGRSYNSAGQELAPREQWGEETGEHPADIARIP